MAVKFIYVSLFLYVIFISLDSFVSTAPIPVILGGENIIALTKSNFVAVHHKSTKRGKLYSISGLNNGIGNHGIGNGLYNGVGNGNGNENFSDGNGNHMGNLNGIGNRGGVTTTNKYISKKFTSKTKKERKGKKHKGKKSKKVTEKYREYQVINEKPKRYQIKKA
ncbi:hypothetical protein G9A89_003427 [Geosiphon pyriformis]|nr:hypothetical protein G9A89_003427 [Geosiphon pyriformis]